MFKFTVCIPAYNRPECLSPLLDSIFSQSYQNFNVLICEDNSPKRNEIRTVVQVYQAQFADKIIYHENDENLGYDGNIRNLVERATGEYCLFMGNDDLMCEDALQVIAAGLEKYPQIGVVLRSYAAFDNSPDNIVQIFRYFEKESFFPAGADSIATFYRRSVVIPGLVVHRESARKYSTSKFDGYLLYQLHLVARILSEKNGLFLPQIVTLYRNGGVPYFGNSKAERGKFLPTAHTPESSLHFIQGLLEIAKSAEEDLKLDIYSKIFQDLGNYSYPLLSIQAKQPKRVYCQYAIQLAEMGFWKYKMFWAYFLALLLFHPSKIEKIFALIKKVVGHTPTLGRVYRGNST